VIVFHNEAWSTLLRTVHSVIKTTSKNILKEIILVDDASTRIFLKSDLDNYMKKLTLTFEIPIIILRSKQRIGLIKARLIGAKSARGKVLTFLDAHCEATTGWLEPLLDRIAENHTQVVCPVIDIIHDETFAYAKSFELHWGGMNWNLHFRWYPIGQEDFKKYQSLNEIGSFRTPIMAGGLFAIDKEYFYNIGAYDYDMDIWGGENIELSLRVWGCGGSIEIVPCSHVAHVFRKSSPYSFPRKEGVMGTLYTNLARVIEVWMNQDYKNFFYKINPVAKKVVYKDEPISTNLSSKLVNISSRIEIKERLQCNDFSWFLKNVWKENFFPTRDRFFGKIQNIKLGECFQKPNTIGGPSSVGVGRIELEKCLIETYAAQCFIYTQSGLIMTDESLCLDVLDPMVGSSILLLACSQIKRQKWRYNPISNVVIHIQTNLCIDLSSTIERRVVLNKCNNNLSQRWQMIPINWYEY